MAQKKYIKQLYENEEKSLREISRIMNLSFQTVRKYAYMEDWNDDKLPDVRPERHPVLKDYIPIIIMSVWKMISASLENRDTLQLVFTNDS